ncbi:phosphoribosyltransferase family protein [Neobacillus sp. NPDC097160]|uniref:phosphoribosyltransferase family protein n=1 Tax=Neobacillus sp. NPDC097160 TaxID=3364298 RepID=UPI0037FE4D8A
MKTLQTLTLSKKKYTFNILDSIETEIDVAENPYELPIEELFTMAARINKKRSFLFVSKVLGKHLPIDPSKGLLTAALLAARYLESVKSLECVEKERLLSTFLGGGSFNGYAFVPASINPVVIGFAETATALGHAFFDCFQTAEYFHTTREELLNEKPVITFEEEHSHATSHRCYIPLEMIHNDREIILVDDEMTTGKTALNIIQSIHAKFPRREYTVVSILDWRSPVHKQNFSKLEECLEIKIHVVSLLSGHVQVRQLKEIGIQAVENEAKENREPSVEILQLSSQFTATGFSSANPLTKAVFIAETGRFGSMSLGNPPLNKRVSAAASFLKQKRSGEKTLCLGTGEFMYLPMKIAAEMGSGVYYQSTTRSPIYIENKEGYGARYGVNFPNPEDQEVSHFVYNIPQGHYDELFIFFEREVEFENLLPMLKELGKAAIKSIKIVFFSKVRGE